MQKALWKATPFLWQIFKVLIEVYYLTKCYRGENLDIQAVLWIIFAFYMKVHFLSFLLSLRCSTASDWVIFSFSLLWIYFCTLLAFSGNKTWDSLVFLWNTLKKYCSFLRPESERHCVKLWNCIHLYLYCEVFHALRINHILS